MANATNGKYLIAQFIAKMNANSVFKIITYLRAKNVSQCLRIALFLMKKASNVLNVMIPSYYTKKDVSYKFLIARLTQLVTNAKDAKKINFPNIN